MSLIKKRVIHVGRITQFNIETVRLPNGHVAELEILHHPGGAAVVALDAAGRVCLLRQFRHAAGGWIEELPAGKLEPNEPPAVTADRELMEEAGVKAQDWRSLGTYVSSPGVFTEVVHLFLARSLTPVDSRHEPGESIEIHWVDFEAACQRAVQGELNDGKTALGLLRAQALLKKG
jgi:8-oxo-dGTP pyrophosphatase MutT (NUDIX family)